MGKPPAFMLYASDFYMDTSSWTVSQVGAYFRLLMHAWVEGSIPADNASRARIAKIDTRNMHKMWSAVIAKKWVTDDAGLYVNKRMEEVRQSQLNYKEKQSIKGKIRAEAMWKDHIAVAKERLQPKDSSSLSLSSSSLKHKDKKEYTKDFLSFWEMYPKGGNKKSSFREWNKLNGQRPPIEEIIQAIKNQISWRQNANGEFRPEWKDPERWIKKECWLDEVVEPESDMDRWLKEKLQEGVK